MIETVKATKKIKKIQTFVNKSLFGIEILLNKHSMRTHWFNAKITK